jgi:hypothetical protein
MDSLNTWKQSEMEPREWDVEVNPKAFLLFQDKVASLISLDQQEQHKAPERLLSS